MLERILLIVALMIAPSVASAESFGQLTYGVPDGWTTYPGRCPGVCLMSEASKAVITIRTLSASSPKKAVESQLGKLTQGGEISVAGQAGHWGANRSEVAAATTMGSGTVIVVLEPSSSAREEDIAAWASLVDGSTVAGSSDTGTQNDYGDQGVAETQYSVQLVNINGACSATLSFADQQYTLGPGETRTIQVTGGDHTFRWQDNDGTAQSGRFNVPKNGRFRGGCVATVTRPEPEPEPAPAPREPTPAPREPAPAAPSAAPDGATYYGALDGRTYEFSVTEYGVGSSNRYAFQIGDSDCPLIFNYSEVVNSDSSNRVKNIRGCATFLGNVSGGQPGQSNWHFQALWVQSSDGERRTNELWFAGQMIVFTDGFRVFSPPGGFATDIKNKWVIFQ